jgi:hypothetical protein
VKVLRRQSSEQTGGKSGPIHEKSVPIGTTCYLTEEIATAMHEIFIETFVVHAETNHVAALSIA